MLNKDLTRPIVGIENRTAQEVFDIMAARIRSALVDVPEVEPVAPSAWLIEDGTDHAWFTVIPSKAQEAESKGCVVTPLFTSPATSTPKGGV